MLTGKGQIENILVEDEMKTSYLNYAMSVIVARALPDVRDGLKPSQRRILVAMNDLNLGPRAKYRKCAKIAGDTSGNYHPHGESVIYPTLVRMAQPFSMRYQLVDGQGNFGSVDGDPAAAMRYTEARMTTFSTQMMDDINMETVDYIPNYDESRKEPVVLPARFPNLICNGASGIAVGMATSIPPHNASEVCAGIIKLIENPDITIKELMQIITGPDFPTGGQICGRAGIVQGYTTGRGRAVMRARAFSEELRGGKKNIVITEIPYQLTKSRVIESIVDAVKGDRVRGVADIRDESDRDGMRLVVELKRGENENVVLSQLFKYTPLQDTFSIIMIALVDGRPVTLNLKQMLEEFCKHRKEIIRRRTMFQLEKAERRAHILEGLRIALANIDAIVELIKKSSDVAAARVGLMDKFALTEVQANAILEMRLQRLTGMEREKLDAEFESLLEQIRECKRILSDDANIMDIIREDMYELKERFGDARRTEIVGDAADIAIEDMIAEENVAITISHEGYIKRQELSAYRRQKRGGKGVIGASMKDEDFNEHLFIASTHDYILIFTEEGKVHWLKVYDIPQMGRTAKGRAIVNLLNVDSGVNITSCIPVRRFDDRYLVMATERGVIKKTVLSAYGRPQKGGIKAINLDDGDSLIGVEITHDNQDIMLVTANGQAIRFPESQARPQGRATRGVRGAKLRKGDKVVDLVIVDNNATLLTICENGHGKRTAFDEYRVTNRGAVGVRNIKTSERNGKVITSMAVLEDDEIMLISIHGMVVRTPVKDVSVIGRDTQGVRVIRLGKEDKLSCFARLANEGEDENDLEEGEEAGDETPNEPEGKEIVIDDIDKEIADIDVKKSDDLFADVEE